jgi:Family of unknown function (DUF5641)
LNSFQEFLQSPELQEKVVGRAAMDNIKWTFIPPHAPHQGGIWEAAVKSMKLHLKKITGDRIFTLSEIINFLRRIQAVLNSRPMWPLTADKSGSYPLTPAHFYLGHPVTSLPNPDLTNGELKFPDRYQERLQMAQHFEKRFKTEYLQHLQKRTKWTKTTPNPEVGQFCLLVVDTQPASKWPTGEIIEVHPGKDNLVRKVTVKTEDGIYQRPVVKIIPFPRA